MTIRLIDTHTHFDVPEYDEHRMLMTERAHEQGVRHLVLIGFLANYFHQMVKVKSQMADFAKSSHQGIQAHLAFGLHPLYIMEQSDSDLVLLDDFIKKFLYWEMYVYEVKTPFYFFIVYLVFSLASIFYKKAFLFLNLLMIIINIYLYIKL